MDGIMQQIGSILYTYGLAGVVMGVEGYVIYVLWKRNIESVKDLTSLHDRIHEESNKESQEKVAYLNQNIITMTKATEAIGGLVEKVGDLDTNVSALATEVRILNSKGS